MSLEDKLAAMRPADLWLIAAGDGAISGACENLAASGRLKPGAAVFHCSRATEDLRKSGILDRIVKVGARAPDFELANHDGRRVSSAELLAGGPMVLSFFRGSW